MKLSLGEIADKVGGKVVGDKALIISCLSSLEDVVPQSLVFADGEANLQRAYHSEAGAILVKPTVETHHKALIQVEHPFKAFIQLLSIFYPNTPPLPSIHPTAIIASTASVGENVFIGPYVTIGENTQIGDHCIIKSHVVIGDDVTVGEHTVLHPHVTIYDKTILGNQVIIHSGTIIGGDGFGYLFIDGEHMKVPHVGHVIIEDDVEIGANTCVDRATIGYTKIGLGTKIDNLVQIAHSVRLGQHNILCAYTGIAGSTISGNHVTFAANVGVSDHVLIDDNVILTARAGVPSRKHLLKGNVYLGNPARPRDKAIEQELSVSRIPLMRKKLAELINKVNQLYKHLPPEKVE